MKKLENTYLENSRSYSEYIELVNELVANGKTSGENQSELLTKFTKLNKHRMHRLEKTVQLNEGLVETIRALKNKWTWVILVEAWCGDVAQNIPTIQKIADQNKLITTHYLLRDENLGLMDQYLTNGGRAIPKLICFDGETLMPIGHWGPRPAPAQEMVQALRSQQPPLSFDEVHDPLHTWYAQDRTHTLQNEMAALIQSWSQ